jgi:rubredoxin
MTNPLECPKCGYERKASDTAPLSQCSACGLIFARFKPSRAAAAVRETESPKEFNTRSGQAASKRFTRKTVLLAVLGVFFVAFAIDASRVNGPQQSTDSAAQTLERYGQQIATTAEQGVLTYRSSQKTTNEPRLAYKVVFVTQSSSLMGDPTGRTDRSAFLRNQGVALVWKARFCTNDLSSLMRQYGIGMVSGQILDDAGEIQAIAICNA